jgi:predicted nucleic acid-binding Zn ribbon protein
VSLEPLGPELRRELTRLGPGGVIADVVAAWPAAVGPAIAANAWPARVARDGTLHVATSSSAWAFELTHLESTVRARLREGLGDAVPARLRFAAGRLPAPGEESAGSSQRTVPTPSRRVRAAAEQIAASIDDPDLREAVARAAAASLTGSDECSDDRSF